MSNEKDFVIEDGELIKYTGPDGDVTIPEGVRRISSDAFSQTTITVLYLPTSLYRVPHFYRSQEELRHISVAEGNPYFKSIDGVMYSADLTKLVLCPYGRTEELHIPHGVKEIAWDAMFCKIGKMFLPATIETIPKYSPHKVMEIVVDAENSMYKSADGILYDAAMETLISYPAGREGEFYVPDGVKCVWLDSFADAKKAKYQIHVTAGVSLKVEFVDLVEQNGHITIFAPIGSEAERMARRCDCQFVEEGEPVSIDDSNERKTRSFQEWRKVFMFTAKSKGIDISKYVRGSKVVYLPDNIGKSGIAAISKRAFLPDVTVLCSKKMFAKLSDENRNTTIHSFLVNRELFTEEEKDYLLEYLKKHRAEYLEKYICQEDYPALEACFNLMPKVKTLLGECLAITEQYEKQQVNLFLLHMSNK